MISAYQQATYEQLINIYITQAVLVALQNAHPSGRVFLGRVFKNAAQNILKPHFLKTGLKEKRASRVLDAGL